MTHYLTSQDLLWIAERLPGDPACDDLGVLDAAVARTHSRWMDQDVYASDWLRAAALLQTLVFHEPLEAHNKLFAWACAEAFLTANGHTLEYKPDDAISLVVAASTKALDVVALAADLKALRGTT
ncbi:fic family toxin-antitoxin system, toxin component [Streptomyces sp. KLMMK]|uniref:fic family toxin-antitoxin system, toxin component n=1 Tax=Streptomyces sp. KLMMK TaxID=3109353 RepID=UPI00300BC97C